MPITMERCFRFEDDHLQAALIAALDQAAITYRRDSNGAIRFDDAQRGAVMDAVCRVRDAQFPWYLLQWQSEQEAKRYREILNAAGLPFVVEQQESGIWFLVRREDQERHTELFDEIDIP